MGIERAAAVSFITAQACATRPAGPPGSLTLEAHLAVGSRPRALGRGRMGLRIAVGGFMHETNTFVAKPTTWNDFVEAGPWPTLTIGEGVLSTFRGINLAGAAQHFSPIYALTD